MALVRQRVVEVFARSEGDVHGGSGYLVGPRTVLTAGFVVQPGRRRVTVRFTNDNREWPATVAWRSSGGPERLDAAVLHLDDTGRLPEWIREAAVVRYGQAITRSGTVSAEAQGFPIPRHGDGREIQRWTGQVDCDSGGILQRMAVAVDGAPNAVGDPSPWSGMTGAAVWSNGLLIGIAVQDPQAWADGRLSFEPIRRLLPSVEFARALAATGAGPITPDAMELAPLAPHDSDTQPSSPAQLLRAEAQVVEFHGRDAELRTLDQWGAGGGTGIMLIHGPGGQGKTRLALEWLRRRQLLGWACTVARADFGNLHTALADAAVARALTRSTVPVLIMIDYAESWRPPEHEDPVARLLQLIAHRDGTPVRILLVARSAGTWWADLTHPHRVAVPASTIALPHLAPTPKARPTLYREALSAFATRLDRIDGYQDSDWRRTADGLEPPRALGQPRYAHALTLFEQALADLLQAGPHPVTIDSATTAEDILLEHESHYWVRTAAAHGVRSNAATLREAVAAMTLFGASDRAEAESLVRSLPGLDEADTDDRHRVTTWLTELYPDSHSAWAPLEPDRLGEHLIATVWSGNNELLTMIKPHLPARTARNDDAVHLSDDQLQHMFFVLDRAAQQQTRQRESLGRIAQIARSELANAQRRAHHPAADQGAYQLLDAMTARVAPDHPDQIPEASGGWSPRWAWWNTQQAARIICGGGQVHLAVADFDGSSVAVAVNSTTATIFDLTTRRRRGEWLLLEVEDARRISVADSRVADGKLYIAAGFDDGAVAVWRVGTDCERLGLSSEPLAAGGAHGVVLAEVNEQLLLVSSAHTGPLLIRDAHTGEQIAELDADEVIHMVVTERFGEPILVAAGADKRIRIFDLSRRELVDTLERHTSTPTSITAFHRGGPPDHPEHDDLRVVVGCLDGTIHVMDPQTGACLGELTGHSQPVTAVRVDHIGERPVAVSTGLDRKMVVWDLRDGHQLGAAHPESVGALALGWSGKHVLAVASGDEFTLRLWDVAAIRPPQAPLIGHTGRIRAITIAREEDQHIAVTADEDRTIRVWDLDRGARGGATELSEAYPSKDVVTAIAVARYAEATVVVTGDIAGRVTLVEPAAGQEHPPMALETTIAALDCRTVGDWFLAAAVDEKGNVRGWDPLRGRAIGPVVESGGDGAHHLLLDASRETPVALVTSSTSCTNIDLITGRFSTAAFDGDYVLGVGILDDHPCVLVTDNPNGDEVTVRILDLDTRGRLGAAHDFPSALRTAELIHTEYGPAVMAAGADGEVWLRDLHADIDIDTPPVGIARYIGMDQAAVAVTDLPPGPAVLVGGRAGELQLVDAKSGLPLIDPDPVNPSAATVARYGGRSVVVIATGADKVVCRDLATGALACPPAAALGRLTSLQTIVTGGHEILLGAGHLGLQTWDAATMAPLTTWEKIDANPGPPGVLCLDDRVVLITVHDGVLTAVDLTTREPYGTPIGELPQDGAGNRIILAARIIRGRPVVFAAGLLGSAAHAWDLLSGRKIGVTAQVAAITHLITTDHDGAEVMYLAHTGGRITEWSIRAILRHPWRRLRQPKPRRTVTGEEDITALAVHPELGLLAARDDILELHPLDSADPRPIHLDAPIVALTCTDDAVVAVSEQGVVLLDLVVDAHRTEPRRRPR